MDFVQHKAKGYPRNTGLARVAFARLVRYQFSMLGKTAFFSRYRALIVGVALISSLFSFSFYCGWRGLDFGRHWDEPLHYNTVLKTIRDGILLPHGFYIYPGLFFNLSLLTVAPQVADVTWKRLVSPPGTIPTIDNTLAVALDGTQDAKFWSDFHVYDLKVRLVFLIYSLLGGVWLFIGLAKEPRKGLLLAFCGAAFFLLSWELHYHSRWVATDALGAASTCVWLCFLLIADRKLESRRWIRLTAFAAGLALATKYPFGLLIPATLLYDALPFRGRSFKKVIKDAAELGCISIATFLAITPGAVLDGKHFRQCVYGESRHYATTHGFFHGALPYDIHSHLNYFKCLVEYLFTVCPSTSPYISLLISAFVVLGAIGLFKSGRRRLSAVLSGTLIAYLIYFPTNAVFMVRNFIFLFSIMSVLAAFGVEYALHRFEEHSKPVLTYSLYASLAAIFAFNGAFLWKTMKSIVNDQPLAAQFTEYLRQNPNEKIAASPELARELSPESAKQLTDVDHAETYAFRAQKIDKVKEWPSYYRDTFRWIGPYEVDFNYYNTWEGKDRILLLPVQKAQDWGVVEDQTLLRNGST